MSNMRTTVGAGQNAADANGLQNVVPQLLAQALMVLRAKAITPSLVNRAYETMAGGQGSVIEVPLPAPQVVYDMTPNTQQPLLVQGFAPGKLTIPLNEWHGTSFTLTDKEELEIVDGTMPRQAQSAMATMANYIDSYILGLYTNVYNVAGIAGVTPFITAVGAGTNTQANFDAVGNTKIVTDAARVLNDNFAAMDDRRIILNPAAQAAALNIRPFQDISWSADPMAIRNGEITEKLGFGFFMNQNILRHVAGTSASLSGDARRATSGAHSAGVKEIAIASLAANDYKVGDIVTFAGHEQTYVVKVQGATLMIEPGLVVGVASGVIMTTLASHTVNLAFQQDAITFVNRPLPMNAITATQTNIRSVLDPESGLALRLEVTRQHKQTKYEFDVLFGGQVLRPEHVVRILG